MSPILFGYLIGKLLVRMGGLLLLLSGLYILIDYVETASNIGKTEIWPVYWLKLPEMLSYLLPLVLAGGILLTVADCRRKGEWTALAVAGISSGNLWGTLLLLPLLVLPLSYFTTHLWAPLAMGQFEAAIHHQKFTSVPQVKEGEWIVAQLAPHKRLTIQRDASGRAKAVAAWDTKDRPVLRTQWRLNGQSVPLRVQHILDGNIAMMPGNGTNGVFAGAISSSQLRQIVITLKQLGSETDALLTTVALRDGVVAATIFVPLLALLLFAALRGATSVFSAVTVAVFTGGLYWAFLMLTWAIITLSGWPICILPYLSVLGFVFWGGLLLLAVIIRNRRH